MGNSKYAHLSQAIAKSFDITEKPGMLSDSMLPFIPSPTQTDIHRFYSLQPQFTLLNSLSESNGLLPVMAMGLSTHTVTIRGNKLQTSKLMMVTSRL